MARFINNNYTQAPGITTHLKQLINVTPPFTYADKHTDLHLCTKSQTITLTLIHTHTYTTQTTNVPATHTTTHTKHILTQTYRSTHYKGLEQASTGHLKHQRNKLLHKTNTHALVKTTPKHWHTHLIHFPPMHTRFSLSTTNQLIICVLCTPRVAYALSHRIRIHTGDL